MVTSRISYNTMHYEVGHRHHPFVGESRVPSMQDLSMSRLRIHNSEEPPPDVPVIYVAMATWIPKCNLYNNNNRSESIKYVQLFF